MRRDWQSFPRHWQRLLPVIARSAATKQSVANRTLGKGAYVYILSNNTNVALYIGVTSDLVKRVYQHKAKTAPGFAERHGIDKLVYYEVFDDIENAILREKRLKGSSRARKNGLVNGFNPEWKDLYEGLEGG